MGTLALALLRRGCGRQSGQALAEYALLVGLIAVAAIGAITLLGNEITNIFNAVGNELANVSP